MGCATGIVKFFMFLLNFAFVAGGIALVALGVVVLKNGEALNEYKEAFGEWDQYKAPPIVLIVVGSVIFFVAFMGCCGVLRESNCMMMTYAVFLTIALLVQVGVAVGVALKEDDFKDVLKTGMKKSILKYDTHKEVVQSWDSLQSNLKCCGSVSYKDWENRTGDQKEVPDSCCKERKEGCAKGTISQLEIIARQTIYTEGCVEKMLSDLKLDYVMIGAGVIAAIELLGIMFSCCLGARFRRKNYA